MRRADGRTFGVWPVQANQQEKGSKREDGVDLGLQRRMKGMTSSYDECGVTCEHYRNITWWALVASKSKNVTLSES